jgi:hypothetical protein
MPAAENSNKYSIMAVSLVEPRNPLERRSILPGEQSK